MHNSQSVEAKSLAQIAGYRTHATLAARPACAGLEMAFGIDWHLTLCRWHPPGMPRNVPNSNQQIACYRTQVNFAVNRG
jgi:hypothetical protein